MVEALCKKTRDRAMGDLVGVLGGLAKLIGRAPRKHVEPNRT